jgi:hypothetical protein
MLAQNWFRTFIALILLTTLGGASVIIFLGVLSLIFITAGQQIAFGCIQSVIQRQSSGRATMNILNKFNRSIRMLFILMEDNDYYELVRIRFMTL